MCNSALSFLFLSIFILNCLDLVNGNSPFNSRCISKNLNGRCVDIETCRPHARAYKDLPDRLDYFPLCNRQLRYVCCPLPPGQFDFTPTTTRKPAPDQRISAIKCREYLSATQTEIKVGSLSLNQAERTIPQNKCQHTAMGLIVGGSNASRSEFPHQALLGYNQDDDEETQWVCGGSLVSSDFILTAAHCLNNKATGPVKYVKLRMLRRLHDDDDVLIYDVDKTFKYPGYDMRTNEQDIALLKLKGKVQFNEHLYPICLPTMQIERPEAIVTGFGRTGRYDAQADNLLKVVLSRFSHAECQTIFRTRRIDRKTMVCYGSRTQRKDACRGDSGGPIQVSNNDEVKCTYKQVGIVSFGAADCGTVGVPGVYVNVFNYIDWIEGIVWKDEI